ncbi:hypothetical protein [Paenibacillus planticolens]|uniref:Uncharacterized protein n=1 Tax=Paenibacillus planticolens TaxID=2654976 RepID=A0ABX1ZY42_9BACL|nr:hypothetical protein [Paenibacillus planticolens]NOV04836.1 hypothetical protein [Paenibacillus planticolens]
MKLIVNTSPFRLEQGYDLGYGPSVYDTMAEVILAFQNPNEDILFSYANWDTELDPHKDYFIQESACSFHFGIIHDPDQAIAQKVKEVLWHHYEPKCEPKSNMALLDELMTQFKETPFTELNEELIRKIGTTVHEMQTIYALEDRDEKTQSFVNHRLVDTTSTWPLSNDRPVNLKNILWYRANTKEEILRSFDLTDWWFTCAIVTRNTTVENFNYFLDYTEEHGEEHDGMVLYITASKKMHFKDTVLPRLIGLLGDKLEVVG